MERQHGESCRPGRGDYSPQDNIPEADGIYDGKAALVSPSALFSLLTDMLCSWTYKSPTPKSSAPERAHLVLPGKGSRLTWRPRSNGIRNLNFRTTIPPFPLTTFNLPWIRCQFHYTRGTTDEQAFCDCIPRDTIAPHTPFSCVFVTSFRLYHGIQHGVSRFSFVFLYNVGRFQSRWWLVDSHARRCCSFTG